MKHTQRKQSTTRLSTPEGVAKLWRRVGAPMTCYIFRTRRSVCLLRPQDIYPAKWKRMQILFASLQTVSILATFFKGAHFPAWTSEHWFQQTFRKMERMQSISVCSEEPVFIPLGCWRFYTEQLAWPPLVGEKIGVLCSSVCLSDGKFICSVNVFKQLSMTYLSMTYLSLSYHNFRRNSDPWTTRLDNS